MYFRRKIPQNFVILAHSPHSKCWLDFEKYKLWTGSSKYRQNSKITHWLSKKINFFQTSILSKQRIDEKNLCSWKMLPSDMYNCIMLLKWSGAISLKWHDAPCSVKKSFICERKQGKYIWSINIAEIICRLDSTSKLF